MPQVKPVKTPPIDTGSTLYAKIACNIATIAAGAYLAWWCAKEALTEFPSYMMVIDCKGPPVLTYPDANSYAKAVVALIMIGLVILAVKWVRGRAYMLLPIFLVGFFVTGWLMLAHGSFCIVGI